MKRLFTQKFEMKNARTRFQLLTLLALMLALTTSPGLVLAIDSDQQDESSADVEENFQSEENFSTAGPLGLPTAAEPDTVRNNIWLTEALMAEIVVSTARVLPPAPAALLLMQESRTMEDGMYKTALVRVLGGLGYDIYLQDDDPAMQPAVDCIYSFEVNGVELSYPDVGRTLGLWRRWIDREMAVTVRVDVTMANSGRVLLSDLVQRKFNDRVSDDYFDFVDSDLYEFTTAETSESGWKSRMEEIIVLGTLAGLVAVYFSNTGD